MNKVSGMALIAGCCLLASPLSSSADQTGATVAALRMAGTITGGLMPSSAPQFTQMVNFILSE